MNRWKRLIDQKLRYVLLLGSLFSVIAISGCSKTGAQDSYVTDAPEVTVEVNVTPADATVTVPPSAETPDTLHSGSETPATEIPATETPITDIPSTETIAPNTGSETEYEDKIDARLDQMTMEEKVGQMLFARCPETDGAQEVSEYQFGGYILFSRDFKDKTQAQVIDAIESYQDAAKLPMLIGVDEEGGNVNRVSKYNGFRKTPFLSPQDLYETGGLSMIEEDVVEKAALLLSLGINVNLAPVADVSTDSNDFIYPRSLGKGAQETADYVAAVVAKMKEEALGCALKHFPGYGNNVDTHTGIAIDDRSIESFEENDFLPFKAGIDAGANIVLVSHNIVNCMDDKMPASLSAKVHEILRNELGFDGVIMTDDLSMDAITEYTKDSDAAVLAVLAGNDLLCCTNYSEQYQAICDAVKSGTITEERIDESVRRILKMKYELGIIK